MVGATAVVLLATGAALSDDPEQAVANRANAPSRDAIASLGARACIMARVSPLDVRRP